MTARPHTRTPKKGVRQSDNRTPKKGGRVDTLTPKKAAAAW